MSFHNPLFPPADDDFTPASLLALEHPPVFQFKPHEPRDDRRFLYFTDCNCLRAIAEAEIRVAIFNILKERWAPETFAAEYPIIVDLWGRMDRGEMLSHDERDAMTDLVDRCREASPTVNRMIANNERYTAQAPIFALAFTLRGWSNLAAPFWLEAGRVSFDALPALADELHAIEEAAAADGVAGVVPGLAFKELVLAAMNRIATIDVSVDVGEPVPTVAV